MRFTEKNKQNLSQKFALNRLIAAVSVAVIGVTGVVHAAPAPTIPKGVPDAGQVLQEIERDLEVKPLPQAPAIEAAPLEEDQGEKIVIKQFKFEGNKAATEAELQDALASLTNHEITITQLKTCVDLISAFYRQKGYLAVATLPEQDITDGVVIINIVEAAFGGVKFDGEYGKDFKRIRPSVIKRIVEGSVKKGAVLNQHDLDHALAITQKMAGFNLSANYQSGEKDGATDVLLTVKDKPLVSGSFSADNTGGRSTGRDKQTATLSFASPLGYGDTLNFVGLHSRGTDYVSASYKLPVGSKGTQLGVNTSLLSYEVILRDFSTLKPRGSSSTFGVDVSHPLWSGPNASLNLELNYDHKEFRNQVIYDGAFVDKSDYKLDVASLVISGVMNDQVLAGAINSASLDIGRGNLNLKGSGSEMYQHQQDDHDGENAQGYYNRYKWNLSRTQFLNDTWSLSFDALGQKANKNLDSSEKFYLGGISGVRAYPTSEGSGSEGYMFKLELRKYLPNNFTVSAFMDEGHIKQYDNNRKNAGDSAGDPLTTDNSPNEYALKGYGFSAAWNGPYNSTFKATYARRFGKNPNPSIDANDFVHDQDGALKKDVFWLNGSIAF